MAVLVPVRPFSHHVLDFLAYLEFERALSRNTLEAYRSDLLQLGAFLGTPRRRRPRRPCTPTSPPSWRTSRPAAPDRPPVAAATLQRKAACLRSFYRHLRREQRHRPRPDGRPARPAQEPAAAAGALSRDEVGRLLARPEGTDPAALRDRALLELMYACGLRASEAVGLDVRDVDLKAQVLRTRGKGAKERLVPVGREALAAVKAWLARGRPALVGPGEEARLFVNRRGDGPDARRGCTRSSSATPAPSGSRAG